MKLIDFGSHIVNFDNVCRYDWSELDNDKPKKDRIYELRITFDNDHYHGFQLTRSQFEQFLEWQVKNGVECIFGENK